MEEMNGVLRLGEVPVVARKNALGAEDHAQAYRSGATDAYQSVADWAAQRMAELPQYEDTGLLAELQGYLADRVREASDVNTGEAQDW